PAHAAVAPAPLQRPPQCPAPPVLLRRRVALALGRARRGDRQLYGGDGDVGPVPAAAPAPGLRRLAAGAAGGLPGVFPVAVRELHVRVSFRSELLALPRSSRDFSAHP